MAGLGLRKARETVETASARVTASAETIARAIGVVAGVALLALGIGLVALMVAARASRLGAARA
jgi:hypothetical protein